MKTIIFRLIGDGEHFSFRHRMFNFSLLLAILMTFLGGLVDLLAGRSCLFWFFSEMIWVLLFYLARFKGEFKYISIFCYSYLIFVFFPYSWIFNHGSLGAFPYYAVLFTAIIATVFTGIARYIMVGSMTGVVLVLISLEYHFPGLINEFQNKAARYSGIYIHLTISIIIIAFLLIVYSNVYNKEKERSDSYASSIKELYQQQLYYMENLEKLNYKLKAKRHDFNHHLGVIYGLLKENKTDTVRAYAGKLITDTKKYQNIVNVPHPAIRAMLNYKLSVAREENITMKLDIKIPGELSLNEFDLSIILGNILDNAIEACRKMDKKERYLDLSILYKPGYLVIQLENPIVENLVSDEKVETSKEDVKNHGFGLKNVRYLVEKNDGFIIFERGECIFKINIALLVDY